MKPSSAQCEELGLRKPTSNNIVSRASPNANVFCALSVNKVYGPFVFAENTIICMSYLDILQLWLLPKLEVDLDNTFLLQQYGAPPHYKRAVANFLSVEVHDWWIAWDGPHSGSYVPKILPC
jgi:hypothetical protein